MRKKGNFWFNGIFFLVTLLSLTYLFSVISEKTSVAYTLGDEAALLMDLYYKGDKVNLFLDESAANALTYSLSDYFDSLPVSGCGTYRGVSLLNKRTMECYPIASGSFVEEVENGFGLYFGQFIGTYPIQLPTDFETAVYPQGGAIVITGSSEDNQRLNLIPKSISQLGAVPGSGNVRPTLLSDIRAGQSVTIRSQGSEQTYYKVGRLPESTDTDYFIPKDNLQSILEALNKNVESGILTLENFFSKAPKDQLYTEIEKRKDALVPQEKLSYSYSITGLDFGFDSSADEPGDNVKQGIVYFHDVWDIAQQEDVNYWLVLSIIETESAFQKVISYVGSKTDGAHGVMQMFKPAITDVYDDLRRAEPSVGNKDVETLYEGIFISTDREDVRVQIRAGTLYLKKIQSYLKSQNKPYDDVGVIIQAYHDGAGSITPTGSSKICQEKGQASRECQESIKYLSKADKNYQDLRGVELS